MDYKKELEIGKFNKFNNGKADEIDDNSIIKKRIVSYADAFAGHFAKRWVTINAETMTYCEIRLLVRTACYLERKQQLESKLSE